VTYCEMPTFYDERRVKARKPHHCCETGRVIEPGEFYWRCTGKWDGEVTTHIQSEAAYHFARHLNMNVIGECDVGFGCVSEWISGMGGYGVSEQLEADLRAEWERVMNGEVTRNTAPAGKETRDE
jgi:hypothetical protein